MKKAKGILITVGVASIAMASVGLLYNLTTLFTDFSGLMEDHHIPHFYPAFYTMSAICAGCYLVLLTCGVQFIRLRTHMLGLFIGIIVFEIVYFFSVGAMWLIPDIGKSVGAATGVANGGLMFQAFTLFPLWAPFLAGWAHKRLKEAETTSNHASEVTARKLAEPQG